MIPNDATDIVQHLFGIFKYNIQNNLCVVEEIPVDPDENSYELVLHSFYQLSATLRISQADLQQVSSLIRDLFTSEGYTIKTLGVEENFFKSKSADISHGDCLVQQVRFWVYYYSKEN